MKTPHNISVFEHQKLRIGEEGFEQKYLDALLKLNEYHEGTYFEPIAKGIQFNQYVGIIQVDGLTIEIHPKADKDDSDKAWRDVLLMMLQKCGHLKAQTPGAAHVNRQNLNLLEVYFELYLQEINGLIRRGLIKQYRKETSNVKALKGKLEFAGNIQKNLIHKERFYTTHQVYDRNHLLHQILFCALDIVEQFTRGTRLYDSCSRTILNFPSVDKKRITKQQLDSITLNRKSSSYSYALELARLIILNYSPDISSGHEKMLSLLFNMNVLWEEYVLKMLRDECEGSDIEVVGQDSLPFWGNNSLRPDIVLKKDNKIYIIDTKWKRPGKSSASVADLRQMYAYCRFWNAEKALLLYPGDYIGADFEAFLTDDYSVFAEDLKVIKHECKMGFVSVLDGPGSLDTGIGKKILHELNINYNQIIIRVST